MQKKEEKSCTGEEDIMSKVITVSRELGSGGREVGLRLAKKLGIPFYDKELIAMAAEDSNISEDLFHANDEVIAGQKRINYDDYATVPLSFMESRLTWGRMHSSNPSFFASVTRCSAILTARTSPLKPTSPKQIVFSLIGFSR